MNPIMGRITYQNERGEPKQYKRKFLILISYKNTYIPIAYLRKYIMSTLINLNNNKG